MMRLAILPLLAASAVAAQPPQPPWSGPPVFVGAEFTPDSKTVLVRFLTVSSTRTAHVREALLYDVATGRRLAGPAVTAPRPGWAAEALHPDGATLLLSRPAPGAEGCPDPRQLVLWDWRASRETRAFDPPVPLLDRAAFTPDGKLVITTHRDNRVLTWDPATGKQVGELDRPHKPLPPSSSGPELVVSADSRRVVTAESDGLASWDLASGRRVGPGVAIPSRLARATLAACSADGRYAVTVHTGIGPDDAGAWVWDLGAGRLHRALAFPEGYVAAAVTEGGRVLAASGRGAVRAWGPDGKPLWRASWGKCKGVSVAAFSPGGRFLLTGGERAMLQLWDTERRKAVWSADESR
jgi:WD40 repeat protein